MSGPATTLASLADIPVGHLESVARHRSWAKGLEALGVETVLDLITHYPRRYVDRTVQVDIAETVEGQEAMVLATVQSVTTRRARNGRPLVEATFSDRSGTLRVTFFNQPWRVRQLTEGTEAVLVGRLERFRGRRQMTNPLVDLLGEVTGRVVPVYPQSERAGLTSRDLGLMIGDALDHVAVEVVDSLPEDLRRREGLPDRTRALHQTHRPDSIEASRWARHRLGFEELLRLQLILVMRKRTIERESVGIRHQVDGELVERFRAGLPFALTEAQERAMTTILSDLAGPHPMHRLLQGDVGSGKTVVAVATLLAAVQGGYQGALMVPTEVLAEQHASAVRALLGGLRVPAPEHSLLADRELHVALLTNRTPAAQRRRIHAGLVDGTVDILIGTHALLAEQVAFAHLGVVVIDEQHRFGVDQRAALRAKGDAVVPDVLVMTATPIPRTAAMTVFGDLDTTVLDELPPGRAPVTTVWARDEPAEEEAWAKVRQEVAEGRQAYVVCPLVEESERMAARSATEERERLAAGPLAGLNLGLLHGQLPASEKEQVMADFRARRLDVVVATTVIEVGVDVGNATVMVVEDADHFGIAQLHQLRGRVGRGGGKSWCYLLGETSTPEGALRLEALERTTDGFELAEVDLDLRGEGTILGTRQKGASDLKLASLRRHRKVVARAREVAFEIVDADPSLVGHPLLREEIERLIDDDDREFLFKS